MVSVNSRRSQVEIYRIADRNLIDTVLRLAISNAA